MRKLPATVAALLLAGPATRAADVFSPGELSRAHAALSGLQNCTKCHPRGEQLSQAHCLACHEELAPRVQAGRGYHGRLAPKERDCWSCHREHQGRDATLVEWGPGGAPRFDHARTGVPLAGKHQAIGCGRCHDPRLVQDPAVKRVLAEQPRRRTYLGAPAAGACAACHFDEHRGQLGSDCARCHREAAWKPAPGFDHARTSYPLTGKHARVACQKCHAPAPAAPAEAGALTAPVRADAFARYRPVAHASCLDCHKDAHEGRFGMDCTRCHATEDWRRIVSGGTTERAFHQRTRYPLAGAHQGVACVACHGPFRREPARFKPLAFEACTDCHVDAHAGQMAREGPAATRCDRCHEVRGFQPAKFGPEEHERTRYPLVGAHRVVACASCHPQDPHLADRLPAAARAELARRGRPVRLSLAVYEVAGDLARCETCHADPHQGQLQRPQGCAACHAVDSFQRLKFDHQKESRFALTGKHATAACAACHRRLPGPGGAAVRYRPLELACAGCHEDVHLGQLAPQAGGPTDCSRCHATDGWKKTRFEHRPPLTDYALTGKHQKVACDRCHPAVQVAPGTLVRRYRGLPRACEGCHADFHQGAFRGFEPTGFGP
jgi:class III cytochrome C family protein